MNQGTIALRDRMREIGYLHNVLAVLDWDIQTYMPPKGAPGRAEQIGVLTRMAHEMLVADETRRLLESAESAVQSLQSDSVESRFVSNCRRDFDRAVKIPPALAAEISRHAALSEGIWLRARTENDFSSFAPSLEKTFELMREYASHLATAETVDLYDPLLDSYEPGAKTAEVAAMFAEIKPALVDLTRRIGERPQNAPLPDGPYSIETQNDLTCRLTRALGYDFTRGRQDQAPHPFCTTFSHGDVRITTRFYKDYLPGALYASLHEAGHALYEQGLPEEWESTPLGDSASMGIHESQSRLWENLVGRSRPFCRFMLPKLQQAFPAVLKDVNEVSLYGAVNRVEPSLIRVEADEVTYNLHVLLRFELERELLDRKIEVADLPAVWNSRMETYLGITPPDDTNGVLQDVHWSGGSVGYFPTYSIGTVISSQLWRSIRQAVPDVDGQIECGDFDGVLGWLRENIHQHGRRYTPAELVELATGEPLNPRYYIEYLNSKFGELYGL